MRSIYFARHRIFLSVCVTCLSLLPIPDAGLSAGELKWTSYRIRPDLSTSLNAAEGWGAEEAQLARITYDAPFRIRVEVEASDAGSRFNELRLQYRKNEGDWFPVGLSDFPYPKYATPELSILTSTPSADSEETEDLLTGSTLDHEEGISLKGLQATPLFHLKGESTEWEWPLVIRRFYDGPGFNKSGTKYEIRLVDANGQALPGIGPVQLTAYAAAGHLGGTFIETPSRIGPYQTSSGRLYFLMEPTETDNRFMVVASDDGGKSWKEVDGAGRPGIGDLEGVGAAFQDGVIHILHQISEAVYYHAFATEDAVESPDKWIIDSQLVDEPGEPPTQSASLAARPDGTLVAVYGGATGGFIKLRDPGGKWGDPALVLETETISGLSGFEVVTKPDGGAAIAYTSADGSGWLRSLGADASLSEPVLLSGALGRTEEENCSILPMLILPNGNLVVIYREYDGRLWERRWSSERGLNGPVAVSDRKVVSGAVDSDQVGADLVEFEGSLHLLFIDDATRSLNYTRSSEHGAWSEPEVIIDGIDAAWVRGSVIRNARNSRVYGFVYDAGSRGGAGFNRFASLPLE